MTVSSRSATPLTFSMSCWERSCILVIPRASGEIMKFWKSDEINGMLLQWYSMLHACCCSGTACYMHVVAVVQHATCMLLQCCLSYWQILCLIRSGAIGSIVGRTSEMLYQGSKHMKSYCYRRSKLMKWWNQYNIRQASVMSRHSSDVC